MKPFNADGVKINENFEECTKKSPSVFALQMFCHQGFFVRDKNGIKQHGEYGDYLIIENGTDKSICPKDEFTRKYFIHCNKPDAPRYFLKNSLKPIDEANANIEDLIFDEN